MSPTSFRAKSKILRVRSCPSPPSPFPFPAPRLLLCHLHASFFLIPFFSSFHSFSPSSFSFSSLLPSSPIFLQTNSWSAAQAGSNSQPSCLRLQSAGTPGEHSLACTPGPWMCFTHSPSEWSLLHNVLPGFVFLTDNLNAV